jgi:hypothetical protein
VGVSRHRQVVALARCHGKYVRIVGEQYVEHAGLDHLLRALQIRLPELLIIDAGHIHHRAPEFQLHRFGPQIANAQPRALLRGVILGIRVDLMIA